MGAKVTFFAVRGMVKEGGYGKLFISELLPGNGE
jgi:hypothetical protein